jgi:FMN phosphatase YigB (HAD superfamily)
MTEIEYVIGNFAERLAAFRGKRIVLHGSRNYAEAIIENFADRFNFIGIMSLDPIEGEFFHGLKVLREEDLTTVRADVVILTERVKYAAEAFRTIRRICKNNNIAVFDMYGLNEFVMHDEAENAKRLTLPEVKKMCAPYDIISIEVVNTIFCYPQNISEILVRKLFHDLIKYFHQTKKDVKFIFRKTYPADLQIEELKEFGFLQNEMQEIIKCEGEDHSFRQLRDSNPGAKILHFGSRLSYDFILPRYYGIDTYRFIGTNGSEELISKRRRHQKSFLFCPDSVKQLKNKILSKRLISFDIFDTLLMRKTLFPRDIFFLTERKALSEGYDVKGFVDARIRAEESQAFCNIYQIYDCLQVYYHWDEETKHTLLAFELDFERKMIVPRTEIIRLLNFAKRRGKKVILTSDMYLPEDVLNTLLQDNGIQGYEKIIVSCEVRKTKQTGLYEELLQFSENKDNILHIGDNPVADGIACKSFGIDSILIPSVLEIAKSRGWGNSIRTASLLMERCLLGLIISRIFRDPFQNPNYEEEARKKQLWRFGICVIAPLVVGHMTWLIQKLRNGRYSGVLFFARDGWLSFNVYTRIQKKFFLPEAIYYYANRKAAYLCCLDFPKEIDSFVERGKTAGLSAVDIITRIFQVPKEKACRYKGNEEITDYVKKHMQWIHKSAENARKGYLRYSEKCGMLPGNTYAVVDFVTVGSVVKSLSQVLPYKLNGLFFGCHYLSSVNSNDSYYLQNEKSLLLKRYVALEPFFSSPEPAQKCMQETGKPVLENEHRSEQELEELRFVWNLAESFARDYFDIFYQEKEVISADFLEEIFATGDFYVEQPTLYDDWFGVPIRQRKEGNNNE